MSQAPSKTTKTRFLKAVDLFGYVIVAAILSFLIWGVFLGPAWQARFEQQKQAATHGFSGHQHAMILRK